MSAATASAAALRLGWRLTHRAWRQARGLPPRADTADRRWLEQVLLPHYVGRADIGRVLLVGTRWYTRHYPALLTGKHCITLDIDPAAARYGSADGHRVADVREVARHLSAGSIDMALFNGVFGWGLDDRDGLDSALRGLAQVLRPGGELVFGWNDLPRHCPFDWRALPAWQAFAPLRGRAPVALPTDNRHRFDFFVRR